MNRAVGWARRWGWLALLLAAFLGWVIWSSIGLVHSSAERRARISDAQAARAYLCDKVNEIPAKIARALVLSDQLHQIIGPTTTVVPADLTAEQQAQLSRLRNELADATRDLGTPIDCRIVTTGTSVPGR